MFGKSEKTETPTLRSKTNGASLEVCHIASGTVLTGAMKAESNIRLEGTIHGTVTCAGRLVISSTGKVVGDIICKHLDNQGTIEGNIIGKEKVHLYSSANVLGNIRYGQLQIEAGAIFNGNSISASSSGNASNNKTTIATHNA